MLPPTWSHGNPVDIIGDAPVEQVHRRRCSALLADPQTGTVLFMHAPTAIVAQRRHRTRLRTDRPRGGGPGDELRGWATAAWPRHVRVFEEAGVAGYDTPEEAVRAFAMLQTVTASNQALLTEAPTASEMPVAPDRAAARAVIDAALASRPRACSTNCRPRPC